MKLQSVSWQPIFSLLCGWNNRWTGATGRKQKGHRDGGPGLVPHIVYCLVHFCLVCVYHRTSKTRDNGKGRGLWHLQANKRAGWICERQRNAHTLVGFFFLFAKNCRKNSFQLSFSDRLKHKSITNHSCWVEIIELKIRSVNRYFDGWWIYRWLSNWMFLPCFSYLCEEAETTL